MKILKLFTIVALFLSISTYAQDTVPKIDETIVSFVPQYLIKDGVRIDVERQIKGQHFIQVCPVFYLAEHIGRAYETSFNSLKGAGIFAYHKYFVSKNFAKNPLYISYGFNYNYFSLSYVDKYLGEDIFADAEIHKLGADVIIGYQTFISQVVSLDVFTGIGTRYSIMETSSDNTDRFKSSFLDFNYSGNLMLLGIRLGFKI